MVIESTINQLKKLQSKKGLFIAAPADNTGYSKAWLRDNIYASLGLELFDREATIKTINGLMEIFRKHEYKLDWAIKQKPSEAYQYIHARYNPDTLEEYWDEWGNKQNDAVGAFLFRVADLWKKGFEVLKTEEDIRILEKVVKYLESIEYWKDKDNGVWEEAEEVHASSVGACLAGLKEISRFIFVPEYLISRGYEALDKLLPNESETKVVDLALLSLIYPYKIVNEDQTELILNNIEKILVREKGVIRYTGDKYYNKNGEAEWTMGFPWLAIIYRKLENREKYLHYMKKTLECTNYKGELPELYYSNSDEHNENSPLGWTSSLYLIAAN